MDWPFLLWIHGIYRIVLHVTSIIYIDQFYTFED